MRKQVLGVALIFLWLGVVLWLAFAWHLPAVAAPPTCKELQIVFLIDQSGSMGGQEAGSTVHPIPNDPLKLRFFAPKHAIEMLGLLRYNSYPDADLRVAIINFGDRPEIGLPWTVITPTNLAEWNQQWTGLQTILNKQKTEWEKKNLGGTNFKRAFEAASSLFSALAPQVGTCPHRAIILLTDGKPEQPDPGFTVAQHFADLQNYVNRFMPRPNYAIYVVAMSQDAYWDETKNYWEKIAGDPQKIGLVETEHQVGQRFQDILTQLTSQLPSPGGVQTTNVCPGEVLVEPYLQEVAFTLFKYTDRPDQDHLRVEDAKGVVDPSRKDITVTVEGFNTPIETIRVIKPLPGRWRLMPTLPRAKCDIKKLSITAVGRLVKPALGSELLQFVRTDIAFQISDSAGNPLPDYGPGYELDITARVADAVGITDLVLAPGSGNLFTAPYLPLEAGAHNLEVTASSQDAEGKPVTIFNQTVATFQVAPVKLVMLEGPTGAALPQHLPITITLAVVGPTKKPVRPALQTNVAITMTRETQTIPLTLTLAPDGSWTTAFAPKQPGRHRLTYQGTVILPDGTPRLLGRDEVVFDVYPATLLSLQIVRPQTNSFEATNWLGLPTGLIFEVQLVDEKGQSVVPAQVVDGDPTKVFDLRVTDGQRRDRSNELVLVPANQTGLFRAEGKTLGPDEYTIQVLPVARLKANYVWANQSWSRTYRGNYALGFFGVLALLGLLAIDVFQCGARWLLARPHPFRIRGTLVIAELKQDTGEYLEAWRQPLPQANYARYANGWVWQCLVPWRRQDFAPRLNIRRLEVRSANEQEAKEGIVRVTVQTTKGSTRSFRLRKGGVQDAQEIAYGFFIYLR